MVRFDARGFGESPDPDADYDVIDDLAGVMAAAGVARAHLVGNSMGAGVARVAAVERPQLVRSLTLVGPGFSEPEPPPESMARLERWRTARSEGDVEVALQAAAELWIGGAGQLERARRALVRRRPDQPAPRPIPDAAQSVELIAAPTLVITGAEDDPWVLSTSRVLAQRIPGARLVLLEGARHHPQEDQPEAFAKALLDFLMVADRAG